MTRQAHRAERPTFLEVAVALTVMTFAAIVVIAVGYGILVTKPKTHLQINTDLAGWWVVNHPEAKDKHAIADPCPLNDPQCRVDRKVVNRLMVHHGSRGAWPE